MLCLSRKEREQLVIGDNIVLTVESIRGNRVKLTISAPSDVPIYRGEVIDERRRRAAALREWAGCRSPLLDGNRAMALA